MPQMPVGFVKTVGILEKTILTLEKTVSTLDFSNVLTVFDSSDSGMLQNGNPTFDLHHKGRMPANARIFCIDGNLQGKPVFAFCTKQPLRPALDL